MRVDGIPYRTHINKTHVTSLSILPQYGRWGSNPKRMKDNFYFYRLKADVTRIAILKWNPEHIYIHLTGPIYGTYGLYCYNNAVVRIVTIYYIYLKQYCVRWKDASDTYLSYKYLRMTLNCLVQ